MVSIVRHHYLGRCWDFYLDLVRNILLADGLLATLFGLDPNETKTGLPLEAYLARVHSKDRPELARVISESIIADVPQQDSHRVLGSDGHFRVPASIRFARSKIGDGLER